MGKQHDVFLGDLRFILEECARIQRTLEQQGLNAIPKEEFWHSIPHPSGTGDLVCGRAAAEKISIIAEEAARRGNLSERTELSAVRDQVSKVLVLRFVKGSRPLNIKEFDRMICAVIKRVERTCVTLTHLLPCHLMSAKDPSALSFGPITFHNRASGRDYLLKKSRSDCKKIGTKKGHHERTLLARALRYYRNFQWVAEVEIVNCDPRTSEALAKQAVTSALDCLQLILGVRNTTSMVIGGPNLRTDEKAKLVITEANELEASLSRGGFGQVHFPEQWSSMLNETGFLHWQTLFATALESITNPSLERPLARRFVDAAQWFGEATRDDNSATRIVKYVTALERMFMTEERDDVSSLVAERVAALCFYRSGTSRESWRRKMKSAYNLRSLLVHGSISPSALKVERGVSNAAEIAETALIRGIEAFGVEGLKVNKISPKAMAKWFEATVKWADAMEASGAVEPAK